MSLRSSLQRLQNHISKNAYALYHSRWMPGRSAVNRSRDWALEQRIAFNSLSMEKQEQDILDSVRAQVEYCRRFVPYYRRLLEDAPSNFPRDLAEYRQIPILDKTIIRNAEDDLLSEAFDKTQLTKHSTGGSTGQPISIYLSLEEHGLGGAGSEIFLRSIGGERGRRIATLYGGDLDVSIRPSISRRIRDWFLNFSNYGCFRLDESYLLSVHDAYEKYHPDVLLGYASAIYLLASLLKKKDIRPNYPCNTILTAAEKLEDDQRDCIETVFNVPVVEQYGSRELGLIAYQRVGDHRLWVDCWDYLIEPAELPDGKNRASILVSRLHTRAMPLLRYQIGDQGTFPAGWNPQHPARYLEEVNGRILDFIYLPQGRMVHGSEFPHLFKDFDVLLYQVVQLASGDVCVSIHPGELFDESQRSRCERIIAENLPGVKLSFKYTSDLERTRQNKLRPVFSMFSPD